jgi:signal transduction histidine kinase
MAHRSNDARWRDARPAFRRAIPLVLVAVALLGSVAVPARQTWRITELMRESTRVLSPARLLVEELQTGLATELAALQSFALSGDTAQLARYRATADEDERRLVDLERLGTRFDTAAASHARGLRSRIGAWRRTNDALVMHGGSRAQVAAVLRAQQGRYDSSLHALSDLSVDLVAEAARRDDRVRALEHLSLVSNAVLVLAAFVAMAGVAALALKERRLTAMLRRRVREEATLREAAETLAGAYTMDEVTQRIASSALVAVAGRGAFVELIDGPSGEPANVVVRAVAGTGVPPLETTCAFAGSYTERATTHREPILFENLARPELTGTICAMPDATGSAIVVPLGSDEAATGALFVVSSEPAHFRPDDLTRAGIFGHLAALAYEKVRLLEESRDRRQVLERVIKSRSRLIRGFSHDVKNPIGAADGFAELLSLGVYGQLSVEQRASVDRMRRNIRSAIALIDDLHEMARAETGNLALAWEPVDLAALVRALGEEYHAAAQGRGLSLFVETDLDGPIADTDRARVRQIAANLVSNAIKYTETGSVTVRARQQESGPSGERRWWAILEVTDSGTGIPADKREYIFEEFSRLGTGVVPGAGLGLAISSLIARRLGGHISVASELGRGSTFSLWLPIQREEGQA